MFSVIIPLYNKEKYIKKTIMSVLDQTFPDFELIVVNDGSTDNSLDIVKSIADIRIKVINKENEGVSSARNKGVEEANFEYIAFLDGDDIWSKDFLFEMKKVIDDYPKDKIFASNFFFIKNGNIEKSKVDVQMKENEKAYLNYYSSFWQAKYSPICSSAIIIHNSVFKDFSFHPSLILGEDLFLWMQLSINYKVVYNNRELAYYNHDIVTSRAIGNLKNKENVFLFYFNFFEKEERINNDLKKLLDYLRMAYMKPYLVMYPKEVMAEIKKIDRSNMDFKHFVYYKLPFPIIKLLNRKSYKKFKRL